MTDNRWEWCWNLSCTYITREYYGWFYKSFDVIRNKRLRAIRQLKYGTKKTDYFRINTLQHRIDELSMDLITIRKNETPLRPAIFTRSSYTAP